MSDVRNRILIPFTGRKNVKLGIRLQKNICWKKADTIYWKQTGSYYNQEERLKELLDNKDGFYNGSESDDSDNDDEIYNENNEQQQVSEDFANNYCKMISPVLLQELINDPALNHQPPFPTCYYSPLTPQVGRREKQTREE